MKNKALIKSKILRNNKQKRFVSKAKTLKAPKVVPEILVITSYPSRECGIATYSQDLINAIKDKFGQSFSLKVCALETKENEYKYPEEVKYILNTADINQYYDLAQQINDDKDIEMVLVQHEFGLFSGEYGEYCIQLISLINKPVITTFHTVLPNPSTKRKNVVHAIAELTDHIIVMTETSSAILQNDYDIPAKKITVIHHGTHLVKTLDHPLKRNKIYFGNRYVLTTFGLLNSGKSIETALDALPAIIAKFPNVLYLIIGKTHPTVLKNEAEHYRDMLQNKVITLGLQSHVKFVNRYLPLADLLRFLQRTNIYLFTSKDPFQAVSGTFAYAMASGCPIISTPIPHAKEMLQDGAGIIVDFQDATQLADATIQLLYNPKLLEQMRLNGLHKIAPTAWENSTIALVKLINKYMKPSTPVVYEMPKISLAQIKRSTTDMGMIQFSKIAVPDIDSGYTIDDNARALIAVAKHYLTTGDVQDIRLIDTYLDFIVFCQQDNGSFLNYVDQSGNYLPKNRKENLDDANGRAIWALGEFSSFDCLFSPNYIKRAEAAIERALPHIATLRSPRAIAFAIKGLYYYNFKKNDVVISKLIITMADDLVSKYRGVSDDSWNWFEDSLTYANSVLPEAMLYGYLSSGSELFKTIAVASFDFLLSNIFREDQIKVVSNQGWKNRGSVAHDYGEQPIDVSYTIIALGIFYDTFSDAAYLEKMRIAFDWFLGKNHLHQIVYNPCTGGCYDGLEEHQVNLNQGAESTVSYLMARLTMEKYFNKQTLHSIIEGTEMHLYAHEMDVMVSAI